MFKRAVSLVLVLMLVATSMGTTVFAANYFEDSTPEAPGVQPDESSVDIESPEGSSPTVDDESEITEVENGPILESTADSSEGYGTDGKFLVPIDTPAKGSIAISTRAQLEAVKSNMSGKYHLVNNIDLAGVEWVPIGSRSSGSYFTGTFDGQGYIIQNLITTGAREHSGLFGAIDQATIKNLGLEGGYVSTVVSTDSLHPTAGGICGYSRFSTITNCFNTRDITLEYSVTGSSTSSISINTSDAGGICGDANSTAISDCYNTGNISSSDGSNSSTPPSSYANSYVSNAGGICGSITFPSTPSSSDPPNPPDALMRNCHNIGDISSSSSIAHPASAGTYAGGIGGQIQHISLNKCSNAGNITSIVVSTVSSTYAYDTNSGGIGGGNIISVTIDNCYNVGDVSASISVDGRDKMSHVGGIIAGSSQTGKNAISNCYNAGVVSSVGATNYIGGICNRSNASDTESLVTNSYCPDFYNNEEGTLLTTAQMKKASSYTGFDFINVWGISRDTNYGYPYLKGGLFNKTITAPYVVSVDPSYDDSNTISTSPMFKVEFDRPMGGNFAAIQLRNFSGTQVKCERAQDAAGRVVTLKPQKALDNNEWYYLIIEGNLLYDRSNETTKLPEFGGRGVWDYRTGGLKFNVRIKLNADISKKTSVLIPAHWNPNYLDQPSSIYNHDLAKLSMLLAAAAYSESSIKEALGGDYSMGLFDIHTDNYPSKSKDTVGYALAHRRISNGDAIENLVIIAIRGSNSIEWYGNFDLGNDTVHQGFRLATDNLLNGLESYINNKASDFDPSKDTNVLVVGHSRGAAIANLVAKELSDGRAIGKNTIVPKGNVFAYTFASPNVAFDAKGTEKKYSNIFNIVHYDDFVPVLPLDYWGAGRYGITLKTSKRYDAGMKKEFKNITDANFQGYSYERTMEIFKLNLYDFCSDRRDYDNKINIYPWTALPYYKNPISPHQYFDKLADILIGKASVWDLDQFVASYWDPKVGMVTGFFFINGNGILLKKITTRVHFSHAPETYVSWMQSLPRDWTETEYPKLVKKVRYACPVDVHVYDENGLLIGRVVDNVIDTTIDNAVEIELTGDDNDIKEVTLSSFHDYTVKLVGTDTGTMEYTIVDVDSDTGVEYSRKTYSDVVLAKDKVIISDIHGTILPYYLDEDSVISETNLYAISSKTDILEVTSDGSEVATNNEFSILVSTQGGGAVSGGGYYGAGETVELHAEPQTGYIFNGWYENGNKLPAAPTVYSFPADVSREIEAKFLVENPDIMVYTKEGGSVSGDGIHSQGEPVKLVAIPEDGFAFDGWYEDDEKVCGELDYNFVAEIHRLIEARFKPDSLLTGAYHVTVAAAPGGNTTGGGKYDDGDTVTLTAIPDAGHLFAGWYENGTLVSTDKAYIFTANADRTLEARFSKAAILLDKTYIVLKAGDTGQARAFDSPVLETPVLVSWKSSNTSVATVTDIGLVTAVGVGTAIITAYNEEYGLAAECRVDVTTESVGSAVTAVNLLQKTVTSNVLSLDYVKVPLQLELEQNKPVVSTEQEVDVLAQVTNSISAVTLLDDKEGYFTAKVLDDRYVELVPNENIKTLKVKTLKTRLGVVVDGTTFTTPELTIKITRTLPKLKATAIKFNRFFPDAPMTVTVSTSVGKIADIELLDKNDYSKVVFDKDTETLKLASASSKPKKLTLGVKVDVFGDRVMEVSLSTSATLKKPSVKLNTKSVVMNKSANLILTGQNITNVAVDGDFSVTQPDVQGRFTLSYTGDGNVSANTNLRLKVSFEGGAQPVEVPLAVKKAPANGAVKTTLSKKTVTLNKHLTDDTFTINVTTSPADAPMSEVTGDTDKISCIPDGKVIKLELAGAAEGGKSYKLKIGNATLTVKVVDIPSVIKLKAKGSLDVINPDSTMTLTPTFTNYNYSGATVKVDNKNFEVVGVNAKGAVTLKLATGTDIKPKVKQSVKLTYSDARGEVTSNPISITPKQSKAKITQSVKQISLQKNDRYSEGRVDFSVKTPAAGQITGVEINPTDKNAGNYDIRKIQDGSYAIGFKNQNIGNVGKGATIKLNVYLAGSETPVVVSVKITVS